MQIYKMLEVEILQDQLEPKCWAVAINGFRITPTKVSGRWNTVKTWTLVDPRQVLKSIVDSVPETLARSIRARVRGM